jgi:hypothetical protein
MNKKTPLTLYMPDRLRWTTINKKIDLVYSSYNLHEIATELLDFLSAYSVHVETDIHEGMTDKLERLLNGGRPESRDDYPYILSFMLSEPRNAKIYFEHLPPVEQDLWRQTLVSQCFAVMGLRQKLHRPTIIDRHYMKLLSGSLAWFLLKTKNTLQDQASNEYYSKGELPITLAEYWYPLAFPDFEHCSPYSTDARKEHTRLVDYERDIFTDFPLMVGLFRQGVYKTTTQKLISAQVEKNLSDVELGELFDDLAPSVGGMLRHHFLASLAALFTRIGDTQETGILSTEDALKLSIKSLKDFQELYFQIFFPYIDGIKRFSTTKHRLENLRRTMDRYLVESDGRWLNMQDITLEIGSKFTFSKMPFVVLPMSVMESNGYMSNTYTSTLIDETNQGGELGQAFLCQYVGLLTSLGLTRAIVAENVETQHTPCERLVQVQLTALGCYVFGLSQKYKAPAGKKQEKNFELDPDRLIIRSLNANNPFVHLLQTMTQAIGSNRYLMTPDSFLNHCNTKEELQRRIDTFQKYFSNDFSPVWKQFFANMLQHANPLQPMDSNDYAIFQLSADNVELQRLITNDTKLKQYAIRAEGFLVLVKKDDLTKFETRLRQLGYLI